MPYIWAMNVFDLQKQTRNNILQILEHLTLEQLNKIPSGLNNNIFWNFGHVVVAQQLLNYRISNLPMKVGDDLVELFRKGSSASTYDQALLDKLKGLTLSLTEETKKDYDNGVFVEFTTYPTSYGITLENIEDALAFNNAHEALHLGYIMALRRMVTN